MNAEEHRETTLDPANRTLVQVSMRDAGTPDEMFRVLMGDKVEPCRDFIEKNVDDVRRPALPFDAAMDRKRRLDEPLQVTAAGYRPDGQGGHPPNLPPRATTGRSGHRNSRSPPRKQRFRW